MIYLICYTYKPMPFQRIFPRFFRDYLAKVAEAKFEGVPVIGAAKNWMMQGAGPLFYAVINGAKWVATTEMADNK